MKSTMSFAGKCMTIVTAALLSWLTVTNPTIDALAARYCGCPGSVRREPQETIALNRDEEAAPILPKITATANVKTPARNENSTVLAETPVPLDLSQSPEAASHESRTVQISRALKSLGASYLILEKFSSADQMQFRARCDLAQVGSDLKSTFEATSGTAVAAMEKILQAVHRSLEKNDKASPKWPQTAHAATGKPSSISEEQP